MTLFQHCTRWRHVTFFYWCRWRVRSHCVQQLGTTADRHTVSRLTYNMSIDIQYVDQHTHLVCRSRYCMSINIPYVDRHTRIDVSRSTDIMSTDIQYVDRHTCCVYWSTYCMSIDLLYVNRYTVCRSAVVPDCSMKIEMQTNRLKSPLCRYILRFCC